MIGGEKMSEIGKQYNDWTVIGDAPDRIDSSGKHHKRYLCQCKCGNELVKDFYKLKNGAKMCRECYLKVLPDNGIPFERKENVYDLSGEYGVGWTTNTNHEFYFDLEDYDTISSYCWYESNRGYIVAYGRGNGRDVKMHQLLCCKGCDHINRLPYDNRKFNLRECKQCDNTKNRSLPKSNTSGFIGVSYDKRACKWLAYLCCDNVLHRLGLHEDKLDAIIARLRVEKEFFGGFAPQRYLFKEYGIE